MAKCFHVQVLQNLLSDATARTTNQNTKKGKNEVQYFWKQCLLCRTFVRMLLEENFTN